MILSIMTVCTNPILASILSTVKKLMVIIQILVPIVLIVTASMALFKMSMNPDEKNGNKKIFNKFIAAAVVFIVPIIVNIVFGLLGETQEFSSCWNKAEDFQAKHVEYIMIEENEYKTILMDKDEYEKGVKRAKANNGGTVVGHYRGEVDSVIGQKLVEAAKSQLGVGYKSMHYGPKGSGDEGFGCAMFVAYCYNQVYFGGNRGDFNLDSNPHEAFYGATTLFWANVAPGADHYNRGFVEVSASEAIAGDVVAQITENQNDPYSSRMNCGHVGLYTGNGMWMEAGGGDEHPLDMNNPIYHYLHYTGYGSYS